MKPSILFCSLSILILASCSTVPQTPETTDKPATLGIGSTIISEKDGAVLVYVPAGDFIMGLRAEDALLLCGKDDVSCQTSLLEDEGPPQTFYLDAFWVDQTEVTTKCIHYVRQLAFVRVRLEPVPKPILIIMAMLNSIIIP